MKKIATFIAFLLLAVLLSASAFAAVVGSGKCGDNLTWTLTDDGKLEISGSGAMNDYKVNTAPWASYRSRLKTLVLNNGVTLIGNYAFKDCSGFTGSLTIPSSVTTISYAAFSGCSGFTGNLTIPSGVTSVESYAFQNCSGFTGGLTIGSGVRTVGMYAFAGCTGLTGSLTVPSGVTSLGDCAFQNCSGFTGALTISPNITEIKSFTFDDCSGLTGSLTIPSGVTEIGQSAFYGCSGLTGSLTIPSGVRTIGNHAFRDCSGFTGSLTIGSGVTAIGDYAFRGCSGFTGSLTIPNGVTTIGKQAFYGCSGFTGTLTVGSGVTTIGDYAFHDCSGFTGSLTIPNGVTTIGKQAFCGCSGFTGTLTVGSGVTTIGDYAFVACNGVSAAFFRGNAPTAGENIFGSRGNEFVITYQSGKSGWTNPWHGYRAEVQSSNPTLTITTQPTDKAAAVGSQVTMSVGATGTGTLSYQWQYKQKTANTWSNASGKTANWQLTVASVHYGFDFRCVVRDTYGNTATSNVVHINPTLTITAQPTDKAAAVGSQVTMSVGVSGTGTLTYQWQYKNKTAATWNNASGKAANWQLTVAQVHYGFDFRCVVWDTYGNTAISDVAHINPASALTITTQPTDKTAAVGTQVTMSVRATGNGTLTYQWQYKGNGANTWNNASGKTANWLLTVAQVHYGFDFRCVVRDAYGNTATSNVVHINPAPALTITVQPTDKTASVGSQVTMSVGASGTGTLSYQWQYKQKNANTWNNASGKTANWLLTVAQVHYGFDFRCVVRDTYGNTATSNVVHVNPAPALTITVQPTDKTAAAGTQVTMSVGASGTGTLSYQWQYKNRTVSTWSNASGKTANWQLTVAQVHYGFDFRCVVTDTYGNTAISNVVHIDPAPALAITAQPTDQTAAVGTQVTMSVGAAGTGTLSYQWQYRSRSAGSWTNASGKTADWVLTVYAVHYGFDFRCVVTDTYGNTAISDTVQISRP